MNWSARGRNPVSSVRPLLLTVLDYSPTARMLFASALRRPLRRRGADPAILAEAVAGAKDREAKRTAEMLMWAAAVAGKGRFPQWFPAAHHIQDPEGRRRSAESLGDHLERHPEAHSNLWRQYFMFTEPDQLDAVRSFVQRDLGARLESAPRRPDPTRSALSSERQLAILARAVRALEAADIPTFLVSGTLLGFVREGRLMEHDYDIDLGVLPGAAQPDAVAAALAGAGFDVKIEELKVVGRDETDFAVDVFLHYERDGLLWHGTEIHEWWNTPFDLVPDSLDGVDVRIPDDPHRYLAENYGTWDRPIAFYNFSFDTPNRRYRQTFRALLYLYKRLITALEVGDRWTVESAARELRDEFDVDVTHSLQATPLLDPARSDPA